MDQENKVSTILILLYLLRLIGRMGKETFKFSRPYSEIWPARLTYHTARTNLEI